MSGQLKQASYWYAGLDWMEQKTQNHKEYEALAGERRKADIKVRWLPFHNLPLTFHTR
jgi:hypothetical protein